MKTCAKCHQDKLEQEFSRRKTAKDGLHSVCKSCCGLDYLAVSGKRRAQSKARYAANPEKHREKVRKWREHNSDTWKGMCLRKDYWPHLSAAEALIEYQKLFNKQGGKCAICPNECMCIDHDHLTGKVRGLLCHTCNSMLGHSKDNPKTLEAGADYLRAHCANRTEENNEIRS